MSTSANWRYASPKPQNTQTATPHTDPKASTKNSQLRRHLSSCSALAWGLRVNRSQCPSRRAQSAAPVKAHDHMETGSAKGQKMASTNTTPTALPAKMAGV